MRASLVGRGSDGLRDGEVEAVVLVDNDAEGAGGLLAGAVNDTGKSLTAAASDHGLALDGSGLHGAGLDDSEGVAEEGMLVIVSLLS